MVRLFAGVALLALGYYVGREVGRSEAVRERLDQYEPGSVEEPDPEETEPDGRD